jgi:hypothetical protein
MSCIVMHKFKLHNIAAQVSASCACCEIIILLTLHTCFNFYADVGFKGHCRDAAGVVAPTAGSARVLDFSTSNSSDCSATTSTATTAAAASASTSTMTLYSGSSTQPPVLSVQTTQHTTSSITTTASVSTVIVGPKNGSSYKEHALLTDGWTGVPRAMSWQWPVACHSSSCCSTSCTCTTRCSSSSTAAVALAGWSDGCIDVIPVQTAADSTSASPTAAAANGNHSILISRTTQRCCIVQCGTRYVVVYLKLALAVLMHCNAVVLQPV